MTLEAGSYNDNGLTIVTISGDKVEAGCRRSRAHAPITLGSLSGYLFRSTGIDAKVNLPRANLSQRLDPHVKIKEVYNMGNLLDSSPGIQRCIKPQL